MLETVKIVVFKRWKAKNLLFSAKHFDEESTRLFFNVRIRKKETKKIHAKMAT